MCKGKELRPLDTNERFKTTEAVVTKMHRNVLSTSLCYLQLLVKRPKPNKMMLRFMILQAIFNLLVLRRLKERKDKVIERPMIHINLFNTRIFITSTFLNNKHYKIRVDCCWQKKKKAMRFWPLFLPRFV